MVEPDIQTADVAVEEEPRYLRRQKPVEIRRRKFARKTWHLYLRYAAWAVAGIAAAWLAYEVTQFLQHSPRVALADPENIEVAGIQHVRRGLVLEKFAADRGMSVLRVPLDARRAALEEIPWVEQAKVSRVLPNGIRVEIVERTPVAFLRTNTDLGLIDRAGVILERPLAGQFRFPVVTGISEITPREERRQRMQEFVRFLTEIDGERAGASDTVSEVDLADPEDLRATLTGLPAGSVAGAAPASVLVHFGKDDYGHKFRVLAENLAGWQTQVGRVDSVDLRFANQVVVNPEQKEPASAAGKTPAGARP